MSTRKSRQFRGTRCLNCETALDISEKYCHQCGQLNSTKKLTIADFFEEFLSNFYAYDSRLRNSVASIFTKPGVLAREFNEGKRQKYANPFRLFLSVSIVLFITFNLTENDGSTNEKEQTNITINEQLENEKKQDSIISSLPESQIKSKLTDNIKKNKTEYSRDSIYTKEFIEKNISSGTKPLVYIVLSFKNYHKKYPQKTEVEALKELGFESTFIYKTLYNKSKFFKTNDIEREVFDFFYEKLPFFIFLSLPILTIIFWIVFYSKKINYTEHLVFAYTYFTFMFICMIFFNLLDFINQDLSNFVAGFSFLILFPIYLYKSLRNFYQQSRWKTILKFVILNPLFGLFLFISAIIMMFIGILLF